MNPNNTEPSEKMPQESVDIDNLLQIIDNGCPANCADCRYSAGMEFECHVLEECGKAIRLLQKQLEETKAQREDVTQILHSYRHICGERTPEDLNRLVTAESEGRCVISPFKVHDTVRHKTEKWSGTVEEVVFNGVGLTLYIASGGYSGYYVPDELTR